jgi:hypothetical protein
MHAKYGHVQNSDRGDGRSPPNVPSINAPSQLPGPPLHWWRTQRPQNLSRRDVKAIRAALLRIDIVHDVDWLRAATGHPAMAIGVAIKGLKVFGMTNPVVDAVVSAVLCCALEGDHAAKVLISSALRRRKKIDPRCHELSLLWISARF